ncbi:MAG TPA: ABC transporter substrate-binding protein [Xanthobacteraceae bacterium]|nr:ABC transporter substrate-binding protein [Xanthobacteraceae bacterium]
MGKFRCRLLLAACLIATPACAKELRFGLQADPSTLDPAQSVTFIDREVLAAVCDKLIELDAKLNYVPQLATEWHWAPDGLALTMRLRPGVVFHDGEPLDAEAVRFNIERDKTAPFSRRPSELKSVQSVTVIDPLTVRFELSEVYAPLLALLADRAGMMVSPKAAREVGDRMGVRPICAGPYRLTEWVRQDRIVLERFERYWNAAAVQIDRVIYLPIVDDAVRLTNLRAGSLQVSERVAPTDLATVRGDSRLKLYDSPSIGYRLLAINTNNGAAAKVPLGSDARLREAFELAIDRNVINQVAFDGAFIPSNQPEAPGTAFHAAAFPVPARDLARAKALVAASGLPRVPVNLIIGTDPLDARVAEIIQAMTAEAGFDVKIEVLEASTLLSRLTSATYEVALVIWSGRADPDANIALWVACDGFINYGKYCDRKLDDILRRARASTDTQERARLYAEAAAIYLPARPYLFLYHLKWFWGASAKLSGFVPHPDGIIRLQGLTLRD